MKRVFAGTAGLVLGLTGVLGAVFMTLVVISHSVTITPKWWVIPILSVWGWILGITGFILMEKGWKIWQGRA